MEYLTAALALANEPERCSEEAVGHLDLFEASHGRALPRTVREWYSLSCATKALEPAEYGDLVFSADRLGRPQTYVWPGDDEEWPEGITCQEEREFDPVALDLLPFFIENQGVYHLAVHLNGSEDPPVVVCDEMLPDPTAWRPHAASFSQWVYTRVWDLPLHSGLRARTERVDTADAAALARVFRARPSTSTGGPGDARRFASPRDDQRVLLLPSYDGGHWDVLLWAATEDLLVGTAAAVRTALVLTGGLTTDVRDGTVRRAWERLAG
ncbi:SMI1/KNR4 family protein [Streptomyces sp. NPDC055607]